MCVSARLPLARWGAATPHRSRLPVWLGLFSSKLCKSVFLCVFPHCFLVYQKGIGPWSGNLAIVSEPTDSSPLPPALASSCGRPWRPAAWRSSTAWSAGLAAGRLLCAAHLPPLFPPRLCAGCSHSIVPGTLSTSQRPLEVLLLFPFYRQGNEVSGRGSGVPRVTPPVLGF